MLDACTGMMTWWLPTWKPGKLDEFESDQREIWENGKSQGDVFLS